MLSNNVFSSVFLDFQSTTPIDPRVLDEMLPYMTVRYGNAHSRSHRFGWETAQAVSTARQQVAKLIGAHSTEVVFTSGATESNNLALKGLAAFYKDKKHIITSQIEHKCVLNTCRDLERQGYTVTYLPVSNKGLINPQHVIDNITKDTLCLSTIYVHNEIGVIQPIEMLGRICQKKNIFFHTDAAQAFGKVPIDVNKMNIDLMSISGHKIYGPKGVGALYVRKRHPRVRLRALLSGGGQERGFRSGTLPVQLIVGIGKAAEIAGKEMEMDYKHVDSLNKRLLKKLQMNLSDIYVNGDLKRRYPGNLNLSFAYVEGESLLMAIKELAVSSGSACTSASLEPSYVLHALGIREDLAHTSLRIGIGRFTTEEEVDYAGELIVKAVKRLRNLSPLWEMKQQGIDIKTIKWAKH
jgi:cysteine desulfurase